MFCGFGAVVLLVLIINSNIVSSRQESLKNRQSELLQQELLSQLSQQHVNELEQEYTLLERENEAIENKRKAAISSIAKITSSTIPESRERINSMKIVALQNELQSLEEEKKRLKEQKTKEKEIGRQVRPFEGAGNRQYLTGLKLGGSRVLLLVDVSASMLDRKIVNIIRRKVRDHDARRSAPKWQRAVSTIEWIIANLPLHSSIQLYGFNTIVIPFTPLAKPDWITVTDTSRIDSMLKELHGVAPINGTNLRKIFQKIHEIYPRPDNIILLTDGLPTQGKGGARSKTISGQGRVKLFEKAITHLPPKIPVNTILFPVEGDPLASVLFWKLAIDTGGSFFTPTGDWP